MLKSKFQSLPRWLRLTLLIVLSLALLGGAVYGILVLIRGSGGAVAVYPAMNLSMPWASAGGASQTNGMVTTDKIQSVYVSSTQEVTEIHVKEGQKVRAGDKLLSFDTTLTDLELERQRIAVEQLKLDLEKAKQRQVEVSWYSVYVPPAPEEAPELAPSNLPLLRKGSGTEKDPYVYVWNDKCSFTAGFISGILPQTGEDPKPEGLPKTYAVFEVRQSDSLEGDILRSWEMIFRRDAANNWSFTVTEPSYDPSDGEEPPEETPDTGGGYFVSSWSELQKMKKDAAQRVVDLELELKMAQLKYETLEYELSTGEVISRIDGVVKSVLEPDEAREQNEPVLLVSGGGGYYITGALSETELHSMHVGDTVTVRSWESGQELSAAITEISPYPDSSGRYWHYSQGNENVSLYPFTVFLPEDAKLRENEFVELSYDPGAAEGGGLCLDAAFVRTENGRSYIWARNEKGLLEKREVRTGRSLWGSYLEVSGFTPMDYLAFPYGRNLREGARTREADMDELYNYY